MSDETDKKTGSFVDEEQFQGTAKTNVVVKPTPTELAIQSIAVAMIKIAQALERMASALETKNPSSRMPYQPLSQPKQPKPTLVATRIYEDLFPNDLRELLSFTPQNDVVIIKPRQFLGTENFAKIASVVKEAGGKYISAGRNSHFEIPIKK